MRPLSLRQSFLLLLSLLASVGTSHAVDEQAYDLLGRVLHPYASLFAEGGDEPRALTLAVKVETSQGFSMDLAGQSAEVSVEYPDKLKIRAPLLGEEYTVCRRGETLWVFPGSKVRALLAQPEIARRLPEPDRRFQLKPFRLPVPQKQLVFLPVLFLAKLAPAETVEGIRCEVLDLRATPPLGKALGVQAWSARVWVDAQARLVRFLVAGPGSQVTARVEKAEFARTLPPETWVPSKEQEGDVAGVPPVRYDQLMRAILGLK